MINSRIKAPGFSLIEVAVVLVILTVLLAGIGRSVSSASEARRYEGTKTKLGVVDAALTQFVMKNRRLPCPSSGTANDGLEGARNASGCVAQINGVVPWLALGISREDAADEWGLLLTYRVWPALTTDGGMDMHRCNPAKVATSTGVVWDQAPGGICSTACLSLADLSTSNCTAPINFLANKGLNIRDVFGAVLANRNPDPANSSPTGAAYVMISHGATKGGGYTNAGVLSPASADDGTREAGNYASLELRTTAPNDFYTDDSLRLAGGVNHFDDLVIRPSVMSVVTKAGLQPRASP